MTTLNNEILKYSINYFINKLNNTDSLYIINKNMEARVLFYYKPDIYFLSDKISLEEKYIDKSNDIIIESICAEISDKFENSDLLRKSLKVKDMDIVIEKYFYDSFIIVVDRLNKIVKEKISLESYNKILVFTDNDILEIIEQNNKILYKESNLEISEDDEIDNELIASIMYQLINSSYPIDSDYLLYRELPEDYFDCNPIILFFNIIADIPMYGKIIGFDDKINYNEDIIYLLSDLLTISNNDDDDLGETINEIVNNFNQYRLAEKIIN